MNNSFLALLILLPQCIQEAQYIALQWTMEGRFGAFPSIWKAKSQVIWDSMSKTPIFFVFMQISRCMRVLAKNLHIHTGIGLKVVYTNKHVFLGIFLDHQSIT